MEPIEERLAYLRGEIEAERISYEEIAELQSLREHIDPGDALLLEWAGVPEHTRKAVSQLYDWYDDPDTGRIFIAEIGVDNNLAEVFSRSGDETVGDNAELLCAALNSKPDALRAGCFELEREITLGGHIGWQDGKWHVFKNCGCSVNKGEATLYELIAALADVT